MMNENCWHFNIYWQDKLTGFDDYIVKIQLIWPISILMSTWLS